MNVSVVPSAKGFEKALRDETDSAARKAGDSAGNEFSDSFGGSIKKIAAVVTAAFAGLEIGRFIKDSIGAASDLNESFTKVGAIFGDSQADIVDWSKTTAKSLGQSQQSALDAASTFAVFGKSAGLTGSDLATFGKKFTGLASDMASFFNTSPEDAIEAIGAALRGESEPIRRYGVLLDDATLRQRAMSLGIITTTKDALTPQQKVLAAQAEIFAQVTDAQGDFVRTSDGLANQQRILAAQFDNLKVSIGQVFLPLLVNSSHVLTETVMPALQRFVDLVGPGVTGALQDFKAELDGIGTPAEGFFAILGDKVGSFVRMVKIQVPEAFKEFTDGFKGVGDSLDQSGVTTKFKDLGDKLRDLVDLVKNNPDVFKPLVGGLAAVGATAGVAAASGGGLSLLTNLIGDIPELLALVISPLGIAALAIGGLAVAAVLAYQKIEPFREAVDKIAAAFKAGGFKAAVEEAGNQFGRLWELVKPKLDQFFAAIGPWIEEHAPGILEGLKTGWLAFANFMATEFWPYLLEKLGVLLAQLGGWIKDTAAPWLQDKIANDWAPAFRDWVIGTAWPWLRDELPKLLEKLGTWVTDEAWPVIVDKLIKWADAFRDWVEDEAIPKLKEKLPLILEAIGRWVVDDALPQIGIMAANMGLALAQLAVHAALALPGLLAQVTWAIIRWAADSAFQVASASADIGLSIGRGILSGIASALSAGWDFATGLVGDFAAAIRSAANRVIDAINVAIPNSFGWGQLSIDIPDNPIPHLAGGGIVNRPTLALIGEAGPEAVVPLAKYQALMAQATLPLPTATAAFGGPITQYFYNSNVDAVAAARELGWTLRTVGR